MGFMVDNIPFYGKIDTDSEYSKVKPGDYLWAKNVTAVPIENQTGKGKQIIRGNKLVFNIPALQAQVKRYRIYFSGSPKTGVTETINFLLPNGSLIFAPVFYFGLTPAITASNAKAAILTSSANLPFILNPNITVGVDYIDLSFTSINGFDYTITRSSGNPNSSSITVVTQESIDITLAGEQNVIGGWDFLNNGLAFSTPQTELPSKITAIITGINSGANGQMRITTNASHGLINLQTISISGLTGTASNSNGIWTVQVINATTFDLYASKFTGAIFGLTGIITINIQGYGQLGFFQEDINTKNWTYTRLLGSKEWNFVTKHQIDCYCEQRVGYFGMYWTDAYNVPRCAYYNGTTAIQDGLLNFIDPANQYEYGSIAQATILILSGTNFDFKFTQQLQSGGGIKPGNWMYAIRLLSEQLIGTPFTDLSNPVNVFSALTTGNASAIWGDGAGDPATSKINQFTVTGLIPGLFKYIELVGVRQVENSFETKFIRRDVLPDSDTTTLQHIGLEADEDFDYNLLLKQSESYATALNINSLDKRLVMSNLTTTAKKDFSAFTATWKHTLLKHNLASVGAYPNLKLGEYEDPVNVNSFVGYMNNETYRFGAKARFKDGSISEVFWIDDIVFNTDPANNNVPGQTNPDNRRLGGLADFNLTDSGNSGGSPITDVYATYLNFSNINLDFLIDGVKVRDLVDEIFIERVDLAKAGLQEIMGSGMGVIGVMGYFSPNNTELLNAIPHNKGQNVGEFTFASSGSGLLFNAGFNETLPQMSTGVGNRNFLEQPFASLYFPDIFYGNIAITTFNPTDELINYGVQYRNVEITIGTTKTTSDSYLEYTGNNNSNTPINISIVEGHNLAKGGSQKFSISGLNFYKIAEWNPAALQYINYYGAASPTVNLSSLLTNNGIQGTDYGANYVQYYRTKNGALKFSSKTTSVYTPTGASVKVFGNSVSPANADIFGGDTFTQKTYFKHRYPTGISDGFGGGMAFYSQNRINTQMRRKATATGQALFPALAANTWLDALATEDLFYNKGYSINNQINNDIAFDINRVVINSLWGRTIYSDLKPENSTQDNFRIFLPLNFHDSDNNNGAIVGSIVKNGELITIQNRKITREFFNTRGILQTQTQATSIVIGDGSVLSRDGVPITSYGSRHKWSIVLGKSRSGDQTAAWIDTESMTVNHLGGDGTLTISYLEDMQSYFKKALNWVSQYDTPADFFGICGYWDNYRKEFVWTIRAQRKVDEFNPAHHYKVGAIQLFPISFSTYEQIPDIKELQADGTWKVIPHDNLDYYTEVTIVFNEYKNPETFGFTTEYTPKPKIYLKRGDKILSPAPISDTGNVYVHGEGNYCEWYKNNQGGQTEDGYIDTIYGRDNTMNKRFLAVKVQGDSTPDEIDFSTVNNNSKVVATDFEFKDGLYSASIKEDSNPSPIPGLDPSNIDGLYLVSRFVFKALKYQRLDALTLKFAQKGRPIKK